MTFISALNALLAIPTFIGNTLILVAVRGSLKLSKKLDDMNTTQERRHEELCNKLAGLEHKTSTLATDSKELKEGFQSLENDLADAKQDVKKLFWSLKIELPICKTGPVATT